MVDLSQATSASNYVRLYNDGNPNGPNKVYDLVDPDLSCIAPLPVMLSRGRMSAVVYHSGSIAGMGFYLNWKVVPQPAPTACYPLTTSTEDLTFSSHTPFNLYTSNYPAGPRVCDWQITAPGNPNSVISLFPTSDVYLGPGDSLDIYDGPDASWRVIFHLTGSIPSYTLSGIYSHTNVIFVRFTTANAASGGFGFQFTSTSNITWPPQFPNTYVNGSTNDHVQVPIWGGGVPSYYTYSTVFTYTAPAGPARVLAFTIDYEDLRYYGRIAVGATEDDARYGLVDGYDSAAGRVMYAFDTMVIDYIVSVTFCDVSFRGTVRILNATSCVAGGNPCSGGTGLLTSTNGTIMNNCDGTNSITSGKVCQWRVSLDDGNFPQFFLHQWPSGGGVLEIYSGSDASAPKLINITQSPSTSRLGVFSIDSSDYLGWVAASNVAFVRFTAAAPGSGLRMSYRSVQAAACPPQYTYAGLGDRGILSFPTPYEGSEAHDNFTYGYCSPILRPTNNTFLRITFRTVNFTPDYNSYLNLIVNGVNHYFQYGYPLPTTVDLLAVVDTSVWVNFYYGYGYYGVVLEYEALPIPCTPCVSGSGYTHNLTMGEFFYFSLPCTSGGVYDAGTSCVYNIGNSFPGYAIQMGLIGDTDLVNGDSIKVYDSTGSILYTAMNNSVASASVGASVKLEFFANYGGSSSGDGSYLGYAQLAPIQQCSTMYSSFYVSMSNPATYSTQVPMFATTYADNSSCSVTFSPQTPMFLKIDFTFVDIAQGDLVEIYEEHYTPDYANSSTLIYSGNNPTSYHTVYPYSLIRVHFLANEDGTVGGGFSASVSGYLNCIASCGGSLVDVGVAGVYTPIVVSNYCPWLGYSSPYLSNPYLTCIYKASAPFGYSLRVSLLDISLSYGYIDIYDGPSASSPLVELWNYYHAPALYYDSSNITSSGSSATIAFHANGDYYQRGFVVMFSAVPSSTVRQCGTGQFEVFEENTLIGSPVPYGNATSYAVNQACSWTVYPVAGYQLTVITMLNFSLGPGDSVSISDQSGTHLAFFTAANPPSPNQQVIGASTMIVAFTTDSADNGLGFQAQVSHKNNTVTNCKTPSTIYDTWDYYDLSSKVLVFPCPWGGALQADSNTYNYLISVPFGGYYVALSIISLSFEGSYGQGVAIYDGQNSAAPLLSSGMTSFNEYYQYFKSSGMYLYVSVTPGYNPSADATGLIAAVAFTQSTDANFGYMCQCPYHVYSYSLPYAHAMPSRQETAYNQGDLQHTMAYFYAANQNCAYVVSGSGSGTDVVHATVGYLDLGEGDTLTFYDGGSEVSPVLAVLTGRLAPGLSISGQATDMYVVFSSNNDASVGNGFNVTYSMAPRGPIRGHCNGNQVIYLDALATLVQEPIYGYSGILSSTACSWTIYAPPGRNITLTVTETSLDSYEYLQLYTSQGGQLIGSVNAYSPYSEYTYYETFYVALNIELGGSTKAIAFVAAITPSANSCPVNYCSYYNSAPVSGLFGSSRRPCPWDSYDGNYNCYTGVQVAAGSTITYRIFKASYSMSTYNSSASGLLATISPTDDPNTEYVTPGNTLAIFSSPNYYVAWKVTGYTFYTGATTGGTYSTGTTTYPSSAGTTGTTGPSNLVGASKTSSAAATAAAVGGAIGSLVFLAVLVAAIVVIAKKRKHKRTHESRNNLQTVSTTTAVDAHPLISNASPPPSPAPSRPVSSAPVNPDHDESGPPVRANANPMAPPVVPATNPYVRQPPPPSSDPDATVRVETMNNTAPSAPPPSDLPPSYNHAFLPADPPPPAVVGGAPPGYVQANDMPNVLLTPIHPPPSAPPANPPPPARPSSTSAASANPSVGVTAGATQCHQCAAPMRPGSKFCSSCGAQPLPPPAPPASASAADPSVCQSCRAAMRPGSKFCSSCGATVAAPAAAAAAPPALSKCTGCQVVLKAGSRFCQNCGTRAPGM